MYININLSPELSEKIQEEIEKELPRILEEILLANDKHILKDLINQKVKGLVSNQVHEVLQDKDFKKFVRDEVMNFFGKEVK